VLEADQRLRSNGDAATWLANADEETRAISRGVNGPLGEMLARTTGFADLEVMEVFRRGGRIAGKLVAPAGAEAKEFSSALGTRSFS
jgi:hypothetical protein